jgi:hypothetical protein
MSSGDDDAAGKDQQSVTPRCAAARALPAGRSCGRPRDAQADRVDVFLQRRRDDHFRRLVQAGAEVISKPASRSPGQ